ncbi:MAG: twin-arginine translocase TatA/TatE family subunit [Bacteroidales bacterium]|nr:twin-arginine translocase TatA/TatE family subunit [Bacteroidales bacterium]
MSEIMVTVPLMFGWWEIVIIAVVALILLGGKKIPEFMRGVGEGVRGFKEGINGVKKDIEKDSTGDPESK